MKDNKVLYIVIFAVIAVVLLLSGVFFNKNGISAVKLEIYTENTNVVVYDSSNKAIANGGTLKVGETYVVEITSQKGYVLHSLVFNNENIITELENNKYTFVCTENVTIRVNSSATPIDFVIENNEVNAQIVYYSDWQNGGNLENKALDCLIYGYTYVLHFWDMTSLGIGIDSILVNNEDISNKFVKLDNTSYKFVATEDLTIKFNLIDMYLDLTIRATNTNIQLYCLTTNTVSIADYCILGYEYKIIATPAEGYELRSLKLNNSDFDNNNTFVCNSEVLITANSVIPGYALDITAYNSTVRVIDTSQVIELNTESELHIGQHLRIEVVVNTGYVLQELTVNGEAFESGATYTVSGAVNIVAKAVIQGNNDGTTYSLTRISENADIIVTLLGDTQNITDGATALNSDSEVQITVLPHDGYLLQSFLVNGVDRLESGRSIVVSENFVIEAYAVAITDENTFDISVTIENATLEVYNKYNTLLATITNSGDYSNVGLIGRNHIFKFIANDGFTLVSTNIEGVTADVTNSIGFSVRNDLVIHVMAS